MRGASMSNNLNVCWRFRFVVFVNGMFCSTVCRKNIYYAFGRNIQIIFTKYVRVVEGAKS